MKTLDQILANTIKEKLTALNCECNTNVVNLYLEELENLCDPDNEYTLQDSVDNCYEESVLTKCLDIIADNN